jgi:signal transduction histidine kinase
MDTSSSTPKTAWYRSLYWRIAGAFVLLFIGALVMQATLLLWVFDRVHTTTRPHREAFVSRVAFDLSRALETDQRTDPDEFLRINYPEPEYPLAVFLKDGRFASIGFVPRPFLKEVLRGRLHSMEISGPTREEVDFPASGPGRRPPPPAVAPVIQGRVVVGVVSTSAQEALSAIQRSAIVVGVVVAVTGGAVAAFVIFRPLRHRLRSLETAARHLGEGDPTARASERGDDEITTLARTFNRMARELESRAAELHAAERARRALLADVSHELRTPLTTMLGYLDTIASPDHGPDGGARDRYLDVVRQQAHRFRRVVDDLLDLARLETDNHVLAVEDVMVEQLFGQTIASCELEARAAGIALVARIAPGAEIVSGDALRLAQALRNLVDNALRHTPAGGRVELMADVIPNGVGLSVRDTGSGIPPEYHASVFERFQKAHDSGTPGSATSGLGLSIVKAIAERHGGTVSVRSQVGRGSTFTIALPEA